MTQAKALKEEYEAKKAGIFAGGGDETKLNSHIKQEDQFH